MARLALADAALMGGNADEAVALGREAVEVLRRLDQPDNLGVALGNLACALFITGDVASSRAITAQALPTMWHNEMGSLLFELVALLAVYTGQFAAAAQMLAFAERRYATDDDVPQANEARMAQQAAAAIDVALGTGEHARLRALGGTAHHRTGASAAATSTRRCPFLQIRTGIAGL